MNDLISRQAAIDTLNVGAELLRCVLDDADIVGAERAKYEWGLGLIESSINDIEELQSAQPERKKEKWIPCSERLPEDDEIVLVSDGMDYAVAFWRSDAHAWDDPLHGWLDSFEFDVKAWMPLPDPYRGERDENRR